MNTPPISQFDPAYALKRALDSLEYFELTKDESGITEARKWLHEVRLGIEEMRASNEKDNAG